MTARTSLPEQLELELDLDAPDDPDSLRRHAARQLGLQPEALGELRPLKRSLDCRKGRVRFHWLVALGADETPRTPSAPLGEPEPKAVSGPRRVLIVGDGPAGLFCAYQLARAGVPALVLDRGKRVQPRRRDLKGLNQRGQVDPDSNYCFGEGGAGTYSDGKLYTRSHKRGDVRDVLEVLALHGAPAAILTDARPHIGSNRLPNVISAMRERLESVGVEFRFESRVVEILRSQARVRGVRLASGEELSADFIVLATGHSARDVYALLERAGLTLEPKPFALGVRIEHPQPLINRIQYGKVAGHPRLPSAAYQLVDSRSQQAGRGPAVFSFCMCPGGFIVPAATAPGELVVNGMSLSRRDSPFANSGIVVSVTPGDVVRAGFTGTSGGLLLQSHFERRAFLAGGSSLQAPATRLTDFVRGHASSTVPKSSYIPGLVASDLGEVLAGTSLDIAGALRTSLQYFGQRLKGFVTAEAVLVGVESRTSSPVRIPRTELLVSPELDGLYPTGEGAGYAGGIVSAAVDGMRVARAITERLAPA